MLYNLRFISGRSDNQAGLEIATVAQRQEVAFNRAKKSVRVSTRRQINDEVIVAGGDDSDY